MAISVRQKTAIDWSRANLTIYGPAGTGKSSLASQAPGALIIDAENGCEAFTGSFISLSCWADFEETLALLEGKHPYETAILDGQDALYKLACIAVGKQRDPRRVHALAMEKFEPAMWRWRRLKLLRVTTGHGKTERSERERAKRNEQTGQTWKERYTFVETGFNLSPRADQLISEISDVVAYMYSKLGRRLLLTSPVDTEERLIFAKDRTGLLPKLIELEGTPSECWAMLAGYLKLA
jgi:hypothetical protein